MGAMTAPKLRRTRVYSAGQRFTIPNAASDSGLETGWGEKPSEGCAPAASISEAGKLVLAGQTLI